MRADRLIRIVQLLHRHELRAVIIALAERVATHHRGEPMSA